jgi:hypothetical protein
VQRAQRAAAVRKLLRKAEGWRQHAAELTIQSMLYLWVRRRVAVATVERLRKRRTEARAAGVLIQALSCRVSYDWGRREKANSGSVLSCTIGVEEIGLIQVLFCRVRLG